MLKIRNLVAGYGNISVLHEIDLDIQAGEFVAVLGPNGAGKSTLLKCIAGVHRQSGGEIVLNDVDLAGASPADRIKMGLGTIPEGRQLFPDMTVRENLILGGYARMGVTMPATLNDDLNRVFSLFPRLKERERQLAGSLSGGEAQMLAIARAIMGKPKLLLCDEPSLGLAPMMVSEMLAALKGLHDEGMSILIADQNATAVLKLADRGYVFDTGRVTASGMGAELLQDDRLHAAYFGQDMFEPS